MNTITLKDLDAGTASSGNSLLSMVQMLSMSMGVTLAGAILGALTRFNDHGAPGDALTAFQLTFVCVGLMTAASTGIFWQLARDAARRPKGPGPVAD